jgi:hypothetical protein
MIRDTLAEFIESLDVLVAHICVYHCSTHLVSDMNDQEARETRREVCRKMANTQLRPDTDDDSTYG